MDQGAAAVLGAAVGVIGTAGTAVLALWGLRWQTRQQQLADVAQWRRGVRRDAYVEFLNRQQSLSRAALEVVNAAAIRPEVDISEVKRADDEYRRQWMDLQFMRDTVELEGPDEIIAESEAMLPMEHAAFRALYDLVCAAQTGADLQERTRLMGIYSDCSKERIEAERRFRRVARSILDLPPERTE